jgi:hypothetical protein
MNKYTLLFAAGAMAASLPLSQAAQVADDSKLKSITGMYCPVAKLQVAKNACKTPKGTYCTSAGNCFQSTTCAQNKQTYYSANWPETCQSPCPIGGFTYNCVYTASVNCYGSYSSSCQTTTVQCPDALPGITYQTCLQGQIYKGGGGGQITQAQGFCN